MLLSHFQLSIERTNEYVRCTYMHYYLLIVFEFRNIFHMSKYNEK